MSDIPNNKFSDRRVMPRVVIPKRSLLNKKSSYLASGDLNYFVTYGIPLIKSHIENGGDSGLIINCVDFSLTNALSILLKYFSESDLQSVFLTKTAFDNIIVSPETRLCYLKTIRYYVALLLRKSLNIDLIVGDIDALIVNKSFQEDYTNLRNSKTTFGIGSVANFLDQNSIYINSQNNYLWRTVKAGFTYFKQGKHGSFALNRIVQSLFNIEDTIPPTDALKLYRAYYGDQLAILFTALELNSAPKKQGHVLSCIGYKANDIVNFGFSSDNGSIWIPPASKRDQSKFELYRI